MLPNEQWRWLRTDNGWALHFRFAAIATIHQREGYVEVTIYRKRRTVVGRDGSLEGARRRVEAWFAARDWSWM